MPEVTRPNIIFIVADDLGYADLGCYGGRAPVSPVLDGLAANGLMFTQGYANSPVCSPTRFALMTGRYQYRLRGAAEEPINSKSRGSSTLGLPPDHPTLPSLLQRGGYRTALIGKWHLGYPPHFGPLRSGYEEFLDQCRAGWTISRIARRTAAMTCGSARKKKGRRLPDRPDLATLGRLHKPHGRRCKKRHAFFSEHALHRAALALGDA